MLNSLETISEHPLTPQENDWKEELAALNEFRLKNAKDCFAYNYPSKSDSMNYKKQNENQKCEKIISNTMDNDKYSTTSSNYVQYMQCSGVQGLLSRPKNLTVQKETEVEKLTNVLKDHLASKPIPYVLRQRWLREKLLNLKLDSEAVKFFQVDDNPKYLNRSIALAHQPMERESYKLKRYKSHSSSIHIK